MAMRHTVTFIPHPNIRESGGVYLEKDNLLINNCFEYGDYTYEGSGWSLSGVPEVDEVSDDISHTHPYSMVWSADDNSYRYQAIPINLSSGEIITLSAQVYTESDGGTLGPMIISDEQGDEYVSITNAGFETGDTTGWVSTGLHTYLTTSFSLDAQEGTYSMRLLGTSNLWTSAGWTNTIGALESGTYTFECWAKCHGNDAIVQLRKGTSTTVKALNVINDGEWHHLTGEFDWPGDDSVFIYVTIKRSMSLLVDDFKVYKAGETYITQLTGSRDGILYSATRPTVSGEWEETTVAIQANEDHSGVIYAALGGNGTGYLDTAELYITSGSEASGVYPLEERSYRAEVEPITGNISIIHGHVEHEITHKITMRYTPDISPSDRLFYDDKEMEIIRIINDNYRDKNLVLLCKERI